MSVSVGGLEENGNVAITVPYGFPNTDAASQRTVVVRIEEAGGGFGTLASRQPSEQYGLYDFTKNVACDGRESRAWVIATSCSGEKMEARQPLPKPDEPKVSVALSKVKGEPGTIEAKIGYDMGRGSTSWSVRLDLLPWIDADGQTRPGGTILQPFPPATRVGTRVVKFAAPSGAQQITVRATATSCLGRTTADASIACDPCDEGASADPVFYSSGNVQVADADPLPPIASQRLARTYNSDEQVVALFGRGWTTLFDRRMILNSDAGEQIVSFVTATNDVVTFRGTGGAFRQTWPTSNAAVGTLTFDAATNTYAHRAAGSNEVAVFRASDGKLIALRDVETGRAASLSHDPSGLPRSLTDSWSGVSWNLTIDAPNRRVSSIAVSDRADLVWSYAYDGNGNLITVTAPGGATWRTYEYAANRPNGWSGQRQRRRVSRRRPARMASTASRTMPSDMSSQRRPPRMSP